MKIFEIPEKDSSLYAYSVCNDEANCFISLAREKDGISVAFNSEIVESKLIQKQGFIPINFFEFFNNIDNKKYLVLNVVYTINSDKNTKKFVAEFRSLIKDFFESK